MPTISARGPASGPSSASNRRDLGKTSSSHQRDALDRNAPKSPPTPRDQQQQRARIQCPLGIHDENFSREDVLLDVGLFPKDTVTSGDLVEVAALRANVTFPSQTTLDAAPKAPANARHTRSGKHQLADRLPHLTADGQQPSGPRGNPYSGSAIRTTDRRDLDPQKRYIFVVKELSPELKLKHSNLQISLSSHIAGVFGFKNRMQVMLSKVPAVEHTASHVELSFRDEYLARADMWRLAISGLANNSIYKGQRIVFMGTIKATVKSLFVQGRKVQSAFVSSSTKPIFRSESARYILFIQMSKEMWDFDAEGTGEIMFDKVINGFLPELFKRWQKLTARHLVSIVLFTRVYGDIAQSSGAFKSQLNPNNSSTQDKHKTPEYKDFYRVVVSDMASGEWNWILLKLKREFKIFLRDVSMVHTPAKADLGSSASGRNSVICDGAETVLTGPPSAATQGNILEAINLACTQFSHDHIDRDLVRTGVSIVVITPGTGVFEVDYNMLALTTDTVIANGIGIDLVCLSRKPLHSVPLFKFQGPLVLSDLKVSHTKLSTNNDDNPGPGGLGCGSLSDNIPAEPFHEKYVYGLGQSHHPKSSLSTGTSDNWSYAVPHWIDVSFWIAADDGGKSHRKDMRTAGSASQLVLRSSEGFQPRVRMYELQMMGVMENEMSDISIPYLHEEIFYPKTIENPFVAPEQPKLNVPQTLPDRGEPVHGKKLSQSARDAFQWMDEYDDAVFRPPALKHQAERIGEVKILPSERKITQPVPCEGSPILGTSTGGLSFSPREPNAHLGAAYLDRKMKEKGRGKHQETRKSSVSSSLTVTSSSGLKPSRISRQISFGPRGIGTGAPKANASTELTSEHAKPGPSHTRGFLAQSPSLTAGLISSAKPTLKSHEPTKTVALHSISDISDTPLAASGAANGNNLQLSRPIAIKVAMKQRAAGRNERFQASPKTTSMTLEHEKYGVEKLDFQHAAAISEAATLKNDIVANALTSGSTISPWLTILNPSNPGENGVHLAGQLGRWQHVFPHRLRTSSMKWKSLCSPAAVPLTTEEFPTADQLATGYQESPYRIARNDDEGLAEIPRTMEGFLRELIAFRLSRGFQLVVGSNVAQATGQSTLRSGHILDGDFVSESRTAVFLSAGNIIHRILCTDANGVEITRYIRSPLAETPSTVTYRPAIRTTLATSYTDREVVFQPAKEEYNWNYVDNFIAGYTEEFTDQLRFWRARFVLIPVEPSSSVRRPLQSLNEDDAEEIRLEGIRKLTQMWQRYRYVPPDERRFQAQRRKRKGTNPLDIMYQTRDPSVVVAAELDSSLLAEGEPGGKPSQLLPDSDLFQRSNLNLSSLAQIIQGEKGVRMMDRRWHWRLHYNCFIGFEFTSWLLQNFKDVDTREEAVELGNDLMKSGLFQHVEKRHHFRDGNFFYQIASEYRTPRPESRNAWFGTRRSEKSVPSTPISEIIFKESPHVEQSRSNSRAEEGHPTYDVSNPASDPKKKLEVALSKVMRYDVDHRKRSYRPEFINLHYDRLHNPDNCYHIRIDWMNVTSKLIEDAIVSWATSVEKFGLRLVEVPIGEASSISDSHPFRATYTVKLASQPPEKQPQAYFDATSFSPQVKTDRHFYHKAIMKKFNFVLDLEAAKDFPEDVNVSYSWGKPDYRFTQYIHRSGVLLAQISDDGDFLLLANRLYNNRSAAAKETTKHEKTDYDRRAGPGTVSGPIGSDRLSPFSSPLVRAIPDVLGGGFTHFGISSASITPETINDEFEAFCGDSRALENFYHEMLTKAMSPGPNTPFMETSIPAIGLPPGLGMREATPSPNVVTVSNAFQSSFATNGSPREEASNHS